MMAGIVNVGRPCSSSTYRTTSRYLSMPATPDVPVDELISGHPPAGARDVVLHQQQRMTDLRPARGSP
jgi:hypothetical protein